MQSPFTAVADGDEPGCWLRRLLPPIYLIERGFSAPAIGTLVTGTLIGTALMALWVGWIAAGIPGACF